MINLSKILGLLIFFIALTLKPILAETHNKDFEKWLISYKKFALKKGFLKIL